MTKTSKAQAEQSVRLQIMRLEIDRSNINKLFSTKTILISAFILQTLYFVGSAYTTEGQWLRGDNVLYETSAWNLANNHGLSFSRNEWEDPYLTELYHARHPESASDEYVPATTLPVGYSIFLGGIYSIFGRSLLSAIIANLILLYISLTAYFFLVRGLFGEGLEAKLALFLTAIYPFWAFWATAVMSDTLHIAFLSLFALSFFRRESSLWQLVLSGVLLGLASMVRPYTILLPIALALAGWIFRCPAFNIRKTAVVAIVCWMILGGWVVRNYYHFDKPMLTSMGMGYGLWVATHKEVFTDDMVDTKLNKEAQSLGLGDPARVKENARYAAVSIERIKQKPFKQILVTLTNAPRLWVSLGGGSFPLEGKIALAIYFIPILVLTLIGIWFSRKSTDPVIVGSIVIVGYYTLLFMPFGIEGRFVLPARFFSFLLAAIAAAFLIRHSGLVEKFYGIAPTTAKTIS